jgi:hypothetical protein
MCAKVPNASKHQKQLGIKCIKTEAVHARAAAGRVCVCVCQEQPCVKEWDSISIWLVRDRALAFGLCVTVHPPGQEPAAAVCRGMGLTEN